MKAEDDDLRQTLFEMFFSDPDVVTCLNKVSAACLHESFTITESGKEIKPRLHEFLMPLYETFLRDCIRMMYLCGFVAYYVRRVNKIPIPFCPAIGTFSWDTTSVSSKKHGSNVMICNTTRNSTGVLKAEARAHSVLHKKAEVTLMTVMKIPFLHMMTWNNTKSLTGANENVFQLIFDFHLFK